MNLITLYAEKGCGGLLPQKYLSLDGGYLCPVYRTRFHSNFRKVGHTATKLGKLTHFDMLSGNYSPLAREHFEEIRLILKMITFIALFQLMPCAIFAHSPLTVQCSHVCFMDFRGD